MDPYLSRLRYRSRFGLLDTPELAGDTRRAFGPDDELVSDTAAVDARIARADFILISHSHFNHCLDMPHIARKTGATVIGTESTIILARAGGVPEAQLLTVRGGEDYEFGALSIKVIPSLHSALNGKHYYDGRVVPRDFSGPRRMAIDAEGGTLAYLIRLAGRRILWFGSMNYIEREVEGLRPDVALIAAARQRLEIHDYTGRLMRALGRSRRSPPSSPSSGSRVSIPIWRPSFAPPSSSSSSPGSCTPPASGATRSTSRRTRGSSWCCPDWPPARPGSVTSVR